MKELLSLLQEIQKLTRFSKKGLLLQVLIKKDHVYFVTLENVDLKDFDEGVEDACSLNWKNGIKRIKTIQKSYVG